MQMGFTCASTYWLLMEDPLFLLLTCQNHFSPFTAHGWHKTDKTTYTCISICITLMARTEFVSEYSGHCQEIYFNWLYQKLSSIVIIYQIVPADKMNPEATHSFILRYSDPNVSQWSLEPRKIVLSSKS